MSKIADLRLQKEKKILAVIALTIFAMICEITLGYLTNSMGLIAQGYHMSVHVLTLALTYVAYVLARKYRGSERFENLLGMGLYGGERLQTLPDNYTEGVSDTATAQAQALEQVEEGIEQISMVTQANAAASEECSAVSEELAARATTSNQG